MAKQLESFGNISHALRRARRLSQRAVSELLGETVGYRQIWNYEKGKDLPRRLSDVERLAEALSCTAGEKRRLIAAYVRDVLEGRGIGGEWIA